MINYYLLTKPGIIFGNIVTVVAGFMLASKGHFDVVLFVATLLGLALVIASACVFNNYIDRHSDQKMERTKHRPLAKGSISEKKALLFALALALVGNTTLLLFTNFLTLCIANVGFFVYVLLYSLWKRHTVYGTAIGSISGGVPTVVGYCAVSNHFDLAALLLFSMMILWQMPHFYAIAIYRLEDYAKAHLPVLPLKKGLHATKQRITLYIILFTLLSSLLTLTGYTGYAYLIAAESLSLIWLFFSFRGFKCANDQLWARKMFGLSLVVVLGFCAVLPFSVL